MQYALIKDGVVQNIIVADESFVSIIRSEWDRVEPLDNNAGIGWGWNNGFIAPPEPPVVPEVKTPDQAKREIVNAVQKRLDVFAQTRNYDGILSACTYANSTVPKFAAEGQYAVNARDAAWATCYQIMAAVQAGQRPMPTVEQVLSELPALAWPN